MSIIGLGSVASIMGAVNSNIQKSEAINKDTSTKNNDDTEVLEEEVQRPQSAKIIVSNEEKTKKKKLSVEDKIQAYVNAKYPILYIDNFDFQVANRVISKVSEGRAVIEFNNAVGRVDFKTRAQVGDGELHDLAVFLNEVKDDGYEQPTIILLKDIHSQIEDPNIISLLKYIAERNLYNEVYSATVIIVSSRRVIPKELVEYISVIDIPVPTIDDIKEIITEFTKDKEIEIKEEVLNDLAFAFKGHNEFQIKQILNLAFESSGTLSTDDKQFILEQKKQLVKKSNLLEIVDVDENSTFDKIGGLENLKKWLLRKERVFNELEKAVAFGVDVPKGALVVGMPGCGKSLAAKTSANLFKIPLVRLDIGRLFGKYIGESEENMRKALKLAEAISPCILWIDEIEKAFSGLGGQGGASDVTTRLFGQFLTWMQEKEDTVFIIATANDISSIPAEFLRKGRFDELFFVDFPNEVERDAIIDIHISKRVNLEEKIDIEELVAVTKGYSGADLEAVVKEAIETCYIEGSDTLTLKELLRAKETIKPISEILEKRITDIREKIEEMDLKPASEGGELNGGKDKIYVMGIYNGFSHGGPGKSREYIEEQRKLMSTWGRSNGKQFTFVDKYDDADVVILLGPSYAWSNFHDKNYGVDNNSSVKKPKWDYKPMIAMNPKDCPNQNHTVGKSEELKSNAISLHIKYGPKYLDYAVKNWTKEHKKHLAQAEYGEYTYSQEIYDEIDGVKKDKKKKQ